MSEGWNEWGKSAIFNEILNDCVRRVNKELLEEKSTAWSQQLINIPVWDELFSDTGNAIDVSVYFRTIPAWSERRHVCEIFYVYLLLLLSFALFTQSTVQRWKLRVEKLIAPFSNILNGIPIDSMNVKPIIMTSTTQDDFPFSLVLSHCINSSSKARGYPMLE